MSVVFDCNDQTQRSAGLTAAVGAARGGRLIVLPTDTLYGIACDAFDGEAVSALLSAKRRGRDMPVPVLVGSWHTIDGLVRSVSPQARALVQAFWPGGLSLVVEQAPSLAWDLGDTDATVMVRMPLHPVAIEVLREVGPMALSSANIAGHAPATTIEEARQQLGDEVAVYLDGGPAAEAVPSTIVDLTGETPRVLREGAVTVEEIADVLDLDPADLVVSA